ncbi:hypothetical protein M3Y97_00164500 [Aphelenchoides bicaudatus]|nr:hypothetical protein M3Y97_00164500 [Aphelenchoides bicaudatus]
MNKTIDADSVGTLLHLPVWLWVFISVLTFTLLIYILLSIFSFPFECGKQKADDDDLLCEQWWLSNPPAWAIDSKNKSCKKQNSKRDTRSSAPTNANSVQARTAKASSLPLIARTCQQTISLKSNNTQENSDSLDKTASTRCETARATCTPGMDSNRVTK